MSLQDVLAAAGFKSALIIDDAFDDIPRASDLENDNGSWSIFFDDIGEDVDLVVAAFPNYNEMDANTLRQSDEFVRAMYALRDKLNPELWATLFGSYESERASDRSFLTALENRLAAAGLTVVKSGRSIPAGAGDSAIVFADLFLGASQTDFDVEESVSRVRTLTNGREASPPAVVLMSRSPLLNDKKERFRDDASMVGAMFRVYRKQELLEEATVETVLERLATHYEDAKRVVVFLKAWEDGLKDSTKEFMRAIRRLDLSDYCKIREVLLEAEGQPLGSYMLDVFDKVHQHTIEGCVPVIDAAVELSRIDAGKYPTPYIAGSPDLQDLVTRLIWQHPDRLRVAGNTAGMPVSFGDVLVRKAKLSQSSGGVSETEPDMLVVLTPACDLMRNPDTRRVLLIGGTMRLIDSKTWKYRAPKNLTSILELDLNRVSIEWNFDDQRMLNRDELNKLVEATGPYAIRARFRESNALELQQYLLSEMGRVGVLSKLPFTFPVEVQVFVADTEGKPKRIDLPVTAAENGVCIIGRDDKEDLCRLSLTEGAVDEILREIQKFDANAICSKAKDTLAKLRASTAFRSALVQGLKLNAGKSNLAPLKVPSGKKDGEKPAEEIVGLIARNIGELVAIDASQQKNAAVIFVINDVQLDAGASESSAEKISTEAAAPDQAASA